MTAVCPSCQAQVQPGAKFCPECGARLALSCASCGAQHAPGQRFCSECGAPLPGGGAATGGGAAGGVATGGGATGAGEGRGPAAPAAPTAAAEGAAGADASTPAEMRLVSVLFVDLVGFTSLSETRDAADVRELLGRYFDSARTIVERYGGIVEKFIGDAVMAVWGAPTAREDDAERAVRAALELVDAVSVFGAEVGAADLRARAGVVTGQVAAIEQPGEGLVVGDRVNTASRVQTAAPPGAVLVDDVTRQVTSAAIAYEDAGEHQVKGKTEPLRLWRAVRVVAGIRGAERAQGVEAPFVGRDGDLRLLKELFHGALERRSARLVAVFGEAGVGKSRLRREFTNYVDGLAGGVLWHEGHCLSYGEGVVYWALAEMVRQRMGISEEAGHDDAGARLSAGLERWIPDPADREFLAPRLGALLGVAQPGLTREDLFAGWRLFFERLAAHQPVALVFEDVQWADEGLLEFIEQLLDWSSQSPIFILTLARPELAARPQGWPVGLRGATVLQLEPLGEEAMRELLRGAVEGLAERDADRIVAQAEGVPLYAIETIRALLDHGAVSERDGRLVLEGEIGELDVPATLGSLLAARLDALEPLERRLVKAMSVFGGGFPRSAAAALSDIPEEELDAVLASLVRKQVLGIRTDRLSPDRGQYAFTQGMLRAVAHGMLSRQERKPRHLAAAEYLSSAFPNEGEEMAEVIAAHLMEAYRAAGGDPDTERLQARTLAALRRAAERALAIGAPETGERLLRKATELAADPHERAGLMARAGEMAQAAGRAEAARELLAQAIDAHAEQGEPGRAARVVGLLAMTLIRLGRNEEAVERTRAALEVLAGEPPDSDIGWLHLRLGTALSRLGRYDEAVMAIEQGLAIAEALKLADLLSSGFGTKGAMYIHNARIEEARLLLAGSADLARRHGFARLDVALGNLANIAMEWDDPDASEQLEEARQLSLRGGARDLANVATGNLMAVYVLRGRWEEAEGLAAEALASAEGDAGYEDVHMRLAILHALRGDAAAVGDDLGHLGAWEHSDEREANALFGTALLCLRLVQGDHAAALEHGSRLVRWTIENLSASNENVRDSWPMTFEAALALNRLEAARELIALLADRPPGHIPPLLNAQLMRGRALLAAAEARHDEVEDALSRVIARMRELEYPYWLAVAQADLAGWLITQDRAAEAEGLLEEAIATFLRLGAKPALARAQALMSQVARSRAVEVS
jgi:class 3 adenylate cyclase/tetratricopeptide (TPR) repeat protein